MEKEILGLALRIENDGDRLLYLLRREAKEGAMKSEYPTEDIQVLEVMPHYGVLTQTLRLTLAWPQMRIKPGDIIRVSVIQPGDC